MEKIVEKVPFGLVCWVTTSWDAQGGTENNSYIEMTSVQNGPK